METYSKLDKTLKKLENIHRSEQIKHQSYRAIQERVNKKRKPVHHIILGLTTVIVSVLFIIGVVSFNIHSSKGSLSSAPNPFEKNLTKNSIQQTKISKSDSPDSFTPQANSMPLGVIVITEDNKWNQALLDALNKMTVLKEVPTSPPDYDFLISLSNDSSLKFKVWIKNKTIIYKDITNNTYYETKSELSKQFGEVLKQMTKR
jgi:hypothetical protein